MWAWPWTKLDQPGVLPSREFGAPPGAYCWEDWQRDTRRAYPVRYFLQETVPDAWRSVVNRLISAPWYWLRTHTWQRYHMVNLQCPTWGIQYRWGWIDRSEGILVASFQLLKAFVEQELDGAAAWDQDAEHARAAQEVNQLYAWWVRGRKQEWDAHDTWGRGLRATGRPTEEYQLHLSRQAALMLRDDEQLGRLMAVRRYLWT